MSSPVPFSSVVADEVALREIYRQPHRLVREKSIDHVDAAAAAVIGASPFFMFATTSEHGTDASPRGGPPGFVKVLDEHRLAWADLSGNNRLDSFTNLLAMPVVGLLFLVPGVEETLRVNGRACLTTDAAVLEATAIDGRMPRVAVGVEVTECFVHCAKAFRRSGLWDTGSWLAPDDRPSVLCALRDATKLDIDLESLADALERDTQATAWLPGGTPLDTSP